MMSEGRRIDDQIKQMERELEQPISSKRRIEIQEAINHLRRKKQAWSHPH